MEKGSTLFLKGMLLLMAVPVLVFSFFVLPKVMGLFTYHLSGGRVMYTLLLLGFVSTALAYFFALYQGFRLLVAIDEQRAFERSSVLALKKIRGAASYISFFYVILLPAVYLVAERDDAPGLILIGLLFILVTAAVAVFAQILVRLLGEAIAIKEENDLTV